MRIAVVGRHPDLEYGFNGLMSLNWLKGLSLLGHKLSLYLPDMPHHSLSDLLEKSNITSLDKLTTWNLPISIHPLKSAEDMSSDVDAIIWQTYRPQEEDLRKSLIQRGFFIAKNTPRVFSGISEKDHKKAIGLSTQYHLVTTALFEDYQDLLALDVDPSPFAYVPRGFDLDLLSPDKADDPVIGFDKAVKGSEWGTKAIDHIVNASEKLKSQYPDTQFLSLRDSVKSIESQRIPMLKFEAFYQRFLNKLWIYLPINFDYSVHVKGKVNHSHSHRYLGLYENQVIEAQLAGSLVVSRSGDIPTELIMLPEESLVGDYDNIDLMVEKLLDHIENFAVRSKKTRALARGMHSLENSCQLMAKAIEQRLR